MSDEELRKIQKTYKNGLLIGILFSALVILYFNQEFFRHWGIAAILIFIGFCSFGVASGERKRYKHSFFVSAYKRAFEKHFTDVEVEYNEKGINSQEYMDTIRGARLKDKDFEHPVEPLVAVKGVYKGLTFRMFEYYTAVYKQRDGSSEPERKKTFQGVFLKVYLPEAFNGEVQIHALPTISYRNYLEKIKFEDINFNGIYSVFATSQKDAFRIIKAKTLLLFNELHSKYLFLNFDCCFLNGTFCISRKEHNTEIYVPFFRKTNTEKAQKAMESFAFWVEQVVNDFKLDTERYTTGR